MDLTELKRTILSCKESITSATQDLTKLTGRNFEKPLDGNRPFSNASIVSRDNFLNNQRLTTKRRNSYENENPVEVKRFRNDKEIPSLNSVVQMTRGRTRNDAIHDLKTLENPKEKERCKRLFGHLMGTLNSIKKESEKATNDAQQITRMKIEKKVEEDHKMISETIQREQNELIRAKKDREFELRNLNQRYRAAEAFERWRVEKEKMKGFIRTSKPPYIFYKPKIINEEAQLRMDETAREIDLLIDTRKKKLESEIERVVKRHQEIVSGKRGVNELDGNLAVTDDTVIGSTVSLVANNLNGKDRGVSPTHSFASEDYDDMIEEIEITMHDEPAAVQDDGDRMIVDTESIVKIERIVEIVDRKVVEVNQMEGTSDESVNVTDQVVDVVDQAIDVVDQARDVVDQARDVVDQAADVVDQAVEVVDQAVDVVDQAVDVVDKTVNVAEENIDTVDTGKDRIADQNEAIDHVMIDAERIVAKEECRGTEEDDDAMVDTIADDINEEQNPISDVAESSQI